jgi:pimeloyl-ACP methyl ester carboxylesterase
MATQQPDRIEAMVLGPAGAQMSEQGRDIMRAMNRSEMPPRWLQRQRRIHIEGDEQIDSLIARFSELADDYEEYSFSEPLLSTISARTLIVTGDRDEYLPTQAALDLYEAIPNSYLWLVPNGAHAVLLTDQLLFEQFVGVMVQFLRGEWATTEGAGPSPQD